MAGPEIGIFEQTRLLTAGEVAEVLGMKPSTIMKWVYEKKIPFVKFGPGKRSIVMFNPKRLNQWLDENSHEPESEIEFERRHNRAKRSSKKTIDRFNEFANEVN